MTTQDLVARLAAHRTIATAPLPELEWLAREGRFLRIDAGTFIMAKAKPIEGLYIVLSGRLELQIQRASGARSVTEWHAGDVTGTLPYSRLVLPPGDVLVQEPTDVLLVDRHRFPDLIQHAPQITALLVHVMVDRARQFTTGDVQDEKLISLGKLAARLAHELNNPASAVVRNARALKEGLVEIESASRALGASGLAPAQVAAIEGLHMRCVERPHVSALSPVERSDRQDTLDAWLEAHGLDAGLAAPLVDAGIEPADLDETAGALSAGQLPLAVRWLAARCHVRQIATETEVAATRVHTLVAAVKGFTYMDQAASPAPVDIGRGLSDTVTVLGSKARSKSVRLTVDVAPGLPRVFGVGGELNQVWANLVENAIDAAPESGEVQVTARHEGTDVVVRVIDNGPGVPKAIRTRIFEPFFTTKPVGAGTGLGLDIVKRLVQQARGAIDFTSEPGRTEFRVNLAVAPGSAGDAPHAP